MRIPQTSLIARFLPIVFLFALFCVAWADMFFPLPGIPAFSTAWFALSATKNAFRLCVILAAMKRWKGFESFSLGTKSFLPSASDLLSALVITSAAILVALGLAGLSLLVGLRNPLDFSSGGLSMSSWRILCMIMASLGIGYSEELFFRYFAPTALERAGFPALAARLFAIVFFGLSHGSQGLIGMIQAALLAFVFFFFKSKGKSLHALALGHGLYDFILLLALMR